MRWLSAAAVVLVSAGLFCLGARVAGRGKKPALVAGAVCVLFLLVRLFFRYFPDVEFALLANDAYAVLRPWWIFLFAFIILGIGARKMATRSRRTAVTTFAILLFLFVTTRALAGAIFDPAALKGTPDKDGICLQTTSYTCSAAAATTLLAQLGIRSSEREMAALCGANPLTGADAFTVSMGLLEKLDGSDYEVTVQRADWPRLREIRAPVMALMRRGFLTDHWVVVLAAHEECVALGDPLSGKVELSKDEFLSKWRGQLIVLQKFL